MFDKFIDYSYQMFPSINTEIKNEIKQFIKQFENCDMNWYSESLEVLSQGDILDNLPFSEIDDDGSEKVYWTKGMILSNTCDMTRDDFIIIAPLLTYKNKFKEDTITNIKNNIVSGKMCLTNSALDDYYIDFSKSCSFKRNIIIDLYEKKKLLRLYSLSQFGFYFLCCKISVYFLRVENHEIFDSRSNMMFIE